MEEKDRMIIMADMQGQWVEEWPPNVMSTQDWVNIYVTVTLQLIINNPYMTATRILCEISSTTWAGSSDQILECFGGWDIFNRTIQRMEPLRAAAANERLTNSPVTTCPMGANGIGNKPPEPDGHIAWWAPQIDGQSRPFLFSIHQSGEGMLCRYPVAEEAAGNNRRKEETEGPQQPTSMEGGQGP